MQLRVRPAPRRPSLPISTSRDESSRPAPPSRAPRFSPRAPSRRRSGPAPSPARRASPAPSASAVRPAAGFGAGGRQQLRRPGDLHQHGRVVRLVGKRSRHAILHREVGPVFRHAEHAPGRHRRTGSSRRLPPRRVTDSVLLIPEGPLTVASNSPGLPAARRQCHRVAARASLSVSINGDCGLLAKTNCVSWNGVSSRGGGAAWMTHRRSPPARSDAPHPAHRPSSIFAMPKKSNVSSPSPSIRFAATFWFMPALTKCSATPGGATGSAEAASVSSGHQVLRRAVNHQLQRRVFQWQRKRPRLRRRMHLGVERHLSAHAARGARWSASCRA